MHLFTRTLAPLHPRLTAPTAMNHLSRTRLVALVAAVAAVPAFFAPTASAQEPVPTQRPQTGIDGRVGEPLADRPAADADVGDAYSFTFGTSVTDKYYFRGYLQEDQGVIVQPYAELGISLINSEAVSDDDTPTYTVDFTGGIWNSVHSSKTGFSGTGPSSWYESDQYGGLTFTTGDLSIGLLYTNYSYPSGAARSIGEVQASIAYAIPLGGNAEDPGDVDFTLTLGAIGAYEVYDGNGDEDAYLEVDVTPEVAFETGGTDLTLSFPFVVGASLKDYYFDNTGSEEFFGFFSVSATLGVPLPMPAKYGEWTLSGGLTYVYLNAESLQTLNGGDSSDILGSVNLEVSF